ncbi:MAG: hypothetical protein K2N85_11060 [Lachnospiraceae bacterium]|nr:hypothetical protein [Lachnospiraceae bacterium]
MKKYLIWFLLLMKRMIKIPAFVVMLIGLFILAIAVSGLEQGEHVESAVGVMIEMEEGQKLSKTSEEWNQSLISLLHEQEGILSFQVYENKEMLMQAVERGEIDCGFILPQDLQDRISEETWQDSIILYADSASVVTQIAKERIAAAVFTRYSEESYVNYIKDIPDFSVPQRSESEREEIIAFAKNAYETHLSDGSTFGLVYNGDSYISKYKSDSSYSDNYPIGNDVNDSVSINDEQQNMKTIFNIRGILAVCIFLSGMCGLLIDWKDRQEKRFLRIVPDYITTMANIWIPAIYTSLVSFAVLICTNQITELGGLAGEAFRLLIYQFLIVVYCSILRLALRKQETIAAAIPILTLGCIICCPVWIRLAVYIPVFRILEKLFPATYYLL